MSQHLGPFHRTTHHLAIGRRSIPGATYFVTACTHDRRPRHGLTDAATAPALLASLTAAIGRENLLIATAMPDHVHTLFVLGDQLSLSQTLGRFKAQTKSTLEAAALTWQRDFFDRRVRATESLESYALYIFLNPYRAGLLPLNERWPWTVIGNAVRFHFVDTVDRDGVVPPEWLGDAERWEKSLGTPLGDR